MGSAALRVVGLVAGLTTLASFLEVVEAVSFLFSTSDYFWSSILFLANRCYRASPSDLPLPSPDPEVRAAALLAIIRVFADGIAALADRICLTPSARRAEDSNFILVLVKFSYRLVPFLSVKLSPRQERLGRPG